MLTDLGLAPFLVRLWPIVLAVVAWSALVGLAAASRLRCDRARAVAVSVLLPVLGPVVVLVVVQAARRRAARADAALDAAPLALSQPAPVPPPVAPTTPSAGWFSDVPAAVPAPPVAAASAPADGGWFGVEATPVPPSLLPLTPVEADPGDQDGRTAGVPLLVCVLAVLPAGLLLLAFFSSWGAVQGPVDLSTPPLGAVPATAVPDVLCLVAFLVAGAAMAWRAAGRWAVLAGTAALATLTTGVLAHALLELSDALVARARRAAGASRLSVDADVVPGDAVPLLIAAGVAGLAWALVAMVLLDRARRRSSVGPATGDLGPDPVLGHRPVHLEQT